MTDEERLSKVVETLRNYKPDFDKTKVWSEGQWFTIEDLRKLNRRRPKPYEWYRRDLKRKRPHRKQGRDLYRGIQDYRRRVGQPVPSKKGLGFRGVATLYDRLRIRVIHDHPEMVKRWPDLYNRYMYLRFPPQEFRNKIMNDFVTPSIFTAGADAISRADTHDDAVMSMAMAMLREKKEQHNKKE